MHTVPLSAMRAAQRSRDSGYDGLFYVAVRTTGIFCRPSCPARRPHPDNVEFFGSVREASFAGYRPCKRCRPLEATGQAPGWMRRLLERVEADPEHRVRDAELRRLGIDPARARRHFLRHYGMTFQAYARARRMGRALQQIRRGIGVDEVALGQGYGSGSGFREAFVRTFGTAPGRSRAEDCIEVGWLESPLGPLLGAANSAGVCLLEFTERRMLEAQFDTLRRRWRCAVVPGENGHLRQLRRELAEYFDGARRAFDVPVQVRGTPFQEQVWNTLRGIPYGETRSYEDIARAVGVPRGVRAVGRTNGLNRICIVIPCHRVVNKDGRLAGYGGGLWRKQALLDLEQGRRHLFR